MLRRQVDINSGYAPVPQQRVPLSGVWSAPLGDEQQQRLRDWHSSQMSFAHQQGIWQQIPYNYQHIANSSAIPLPQSLGLFNQQGQGEKLDANLGSSNPQWNRAQCAPTNMQVVTLPLPGNQATVHLPIAGTQVEPNERNNTMAQLLLADYISRKAAIEAEYFPRAEPNTQDSQVILSREEDIAAYALLSLDHKRKRSVGEAESSPVSSDKHEPPTPAANSPKRVNRVGVQNDKNATAEASGKSGWASSASLTEDETCQHPDGCTRSGKGKTKGLCTKHGGHKRCSHDSDCPKQAVKKGVCCAHGGSRKCTHASGCQKHALWRGLCTAHGGARLCTHESGCKKLVTLKGVCTAHGGRRNCEHGSGCTKLAISKGLCIGHGGGKRCTHDSGCQKRVVSRELCTAHGGGKRCTEDGCEKRALSKGICFEHGGGTRCTHDSGCESRALKRGLCQAHGGRKKDEE